MVDQRGLVVALGLVRWGLVHWGLASFRGRHDTGLSSCGGRTLLAGLAFSFSKIFWDWAFVALILAEMPESTENVGQQRFVTVGRGYYR